MSWRSWVSCIAVLVATSAGHAQGNEPALPGPELGAPAKAAESEVVAGVDANSAAGGASAETFEQLWLSRRQALAQFDRTHADAVLMAMVEAKQAASWPNLTTYGLAVARESIAVGKTGEVARALRLAEAASKLAPYRPETWVARAKADFGAREFLHTARDIAKAAGVILSDPIELRLRLGNLAIASMIALLVASIVFALIALYRHQRQLIFGVLQILPNGATRLQAALIVIAAVATPLFVGLGLVWTVLIWVALPILYYERRERAGACLVLAFLALLPAALPRASQYLGYPGSRAQDVYLAATDMGAREAAARVLAQPQPSAAELLALGLRERYAGHVEQATHYLEQAIERGMDHPSVYTILGNLRFYAQDRPGAIAAYQRALSLEPKHVPALFNISRVYFSLTEHQKAGEAHRTATTVDYEEVELYDREAKQRGPTYMAADEVPRSVFASHNAMAPQVSAAAHDVWRELSGRTIPIWYIGVASGICLLVALVGLVTKKTPPATSLAAKARNGTTERTNVEPLQRIRHEIEVHRHSVRLLRMRRVASVLIAGAGQLMIGRALLGLTFLVVFVTSVIMLLVALDIVPSPVPLAAGPSALAMVVYAGLALVVYVASLWDSQREDG